MHEFNLLVKLLIEKINPSEPDKWTCSLYLGIDTVENRSGAGYSTHTGAHLRG